MCNNKRFSVPLVLWLFIVGGCSSVPRAQTPLTTLPGTQGGMIVYGLVEGASTPASAMAHILRIVQNNCGDKPQVGRVFRVKGNNSDAVFFTVTNRAQGNQPVAGEVIAAPTGPKTVEAALVSDSAARFGTTLNPLLNQLFGVLPPGGGGAAGSRAAGSRASGSGPAPPEQLHQVWNQDHSALIAIPNGWKVQG